MRWSASSIRRAAGFFLDGKPELCPVSGLGSTASSHQNLANSRRMGPIPTNLDLARASSYSSRPCDSGCAPLVARLSDSGSGEDPLASADEEFSPKTAPPAQPSGPDGVLENMATLVLDKPVLGADPADRLGERPATSSRLDPASLDSASDAAIMLRAAAGDEAEFNYLAEKYHRPIIHFLFRMVHNQAIAEELAQEVFLRVYRSRESYRAEAKFTTWLYRIATNLAVNHARDSRHERTARNVYLDAPDEETGTTPEVADDQPSVEQRLLREERMEAIRKHITALPERQRVAVLMHKYQGMDYREIGEVLKLSESATKSLLFRAYQTLRDKLKDFV